jgi:hypothetical protein
MTPRSAFWSPTAASCRLLGLSAEYPPPVRLSALPCGLLRAPGAGSPKVRVFWLASPEYRDGMSPQTSGATSGVLCSGRCGWSASLAFGTRGQCLLPYHPHALAAYRYLVRCASQLAQHLPLQGLLGCPLDPHRVVLPVVGLAVHCPSVHRRSYPPNTSSPPEAPKLRPRCLPSFYLREDTSSLIWAFISRIAPRM